MRLRSPERHASASPIAACDRALGRGERLAEIICSWIMSGNSTTTVRPRKPGLMSTNNPAVTVSTRLNHSITSFERGPMIASRPAWTMWPPSSGTTGNRLNSPITGPVHQIASDAALSANESRSSGFTPINSSTASPMPICTAGPATEMPARSHRFKGRVGTNDA